ncbi:MAG: hypothetical protein R6U38_16160 [Desulfatiglandaceae bacterium]
MDQEEYNKKFVNLRILKSVQEYIKTEGEGTDTVYPIKVPTDLFYQSLKLHGPDSTDKLIHHIFRIGLETWSEEFFNNAFGSQENLERFIELVKERNKEEDS